MRNASDCDAGGVHNSFREHEISILDFIQLHNGKEAKIDKGIGSRTSEFEARLGRSRSGTACLRSRNRRPEAVTVCIHTYEANTGRMHYDLYRTHGLPVGSRVVERAYKHIVGSRFKKIGMPLVERGCQRPARWQMLLKNICWPDFLDWRTYHTVAT